MVATYAGRRTPTAPRWSGAHVVVTGGSSGIGRAFVREVSSRGASVSVLALDDRDLADTASELRRAAATHVEIPVDVRDGDAVGVAVRRAAALLGPPQALLTCAGIAHPGYFQCLDGEIFRRTMDIDYFGTLHAVRAVAPGMIERRAGSVVGVSSVAGVIGVFGYSAYRPAKYAVRGLLEVLRVELRPYGIHVGCVCPPDTDTPQLAYEDRFKPDETRAISGTITPMTAAEVAHAIVRGMKRGRFLILPGWQARVIARTVGLMRGSYAGMVDRRVRQARLTRPGAPGTPAAAPRAPVPRR